MTANTAVPGTVLRHRPFLLYWSARTRAAIGFQMLRVAVARQMYSITGSAFDLGLIGAGAIPAVDAGGRTGRRLFGVGRAFEAPTQQTLLPAVVPAALFPRAVAAAASTTQLATISGPALGGILYVFGATVPYATCSDIGGLRRARFQFRASLAAGYHPVAARSGAAGLPSQ
jgi:hypothetical protein